MTSARIKTREIRNSLVAIALGLLGTVQYHRAQFTSRFDTFFGDRGDVRGVVYFCEHWYQWLLGKTTLMSPGIFYPAKGTLAYSDFLVGYAIPYSAVRALGFGMLSSMEIVVVALTLMNYLACFFLLRHAFRFGVLPACAGAMFFAFNSPKFFQTGHLQLNYVVFLPLIFACVILLARKSSGLSQRKAAGLLAAAALLVLLQAVTAFYYLWFLVFWSLLFFLIALVLPSSRRFLFALTKRFWPAILLAAGVSAIGFTLFLISYLPGIRQGQWYRYDYVIQMVPTWWSLLSMGDGNYLWGWLSAAVIPKPWPATWGELKIGIGLLPSLAWIAITAWIAWRAPSAGKAATSNSDQPSPAPAFLTALVLATTLFYLIGFNYGHDHSPWSLVYTYFPGAKAIRAVSRYVIFLTLPMAITFAFLLDLGLRRASQQATQFRRRGLAALILIVAGFGIFEQFGVFKVGGTGFSKKAEEAYLRAQANKLSSDCTAFYIAPGNGKHNPFEYQYDAMLISAMTHIPTLNASSSQFPKDWLLYQVSDPAYENNVKRWIELNHIAGKVCRLEVSPQAEAFDIRAPGPLDDPDFFVRQQYRDLAGREPSAEEIKPYVDRFQQCKSVRTCNDQIAAEVFRNSGFSDDGSFIYRIYQIGGGRAPSYQEFVSDLAEFHTQESADRKASFVERFVSRTEFVDRYGRLAEAEYVNSLLSNAQTGGSDAMRKSLLDSKKSRSQILLEIASDAEVARAFEDRAVVTLHYFGYLRRDPDSGGFGGWVNSLAKTRDVGRVTSGFVNSIEYRQRFFQ